MTVFRCPTCRASFVVTEAILPVNCCNRSYQHLRDIPTAGEGPGPIRRAANFVAAAAKHVATGRKLVDDYTRNWRLEQCQACDEFFDHELETCLHKQCGCGMKKKRGIVDALGWESKRCPIGRWDNPPPPDVLMVYYKTKSEVSIGLGVNAQSSANVLGAAGIPVQSIAVSGVDELMGLLSTESPPKLVTLEGCWLSPDDMVALAAENYRTAFTMRCHSQVAFLQIEPDSIGRLHDVARYSLKYPNIFLSGNSRRFTDWASEAWDCNCRYLPNLYPTKDMPAPSLDRGKRATIRIGVFGRMRHQKHHACSAAVVALMARRNPSKPAMLFVNQDDSAPGSKSILSAVKQMASGVPNLSFHEVPWQSADKFRQTIAGMDLCLQLSASETFNLVTADAAAAGVPSVVGEAIDWVPKDWRAPVDNPIEAADVADYLLAEDTAGQRGQAALRAHAAHAEAAWLEVISQGDVASPQLVAS